MSSLATHGSCSKCHEANDLCSLACQFCGARLPWASDLENERRESQAQARAAEQSRQQSLRQQQRQDAQEQAVRRTAEARLAGSWICESCGFVGTPKIYQKGSDWVGCFLMAALFIPGLIYLLWNASTRYKGCSRCSGKNIIPVSSPRGQQLFTYYHPSGS